jgi:hypothetical protein
MEKGGGGPHYHSSLSSRKIWMRNGGMTSMKMILKIISPSFHNDLNPPDPFKNDTQIADTFPE